MPKTLKPELSPSEKRKATMIAKYGSEALWKTEMRKWRALSSNSGKGGFAYLKEHDPARLKEISKKGAEARGQGENRQGGQIFQPVDTDT